VPSKNGKADFDDLYVKRRGLAQGSALGGSQRLQNFQGIHFLQKFLKSGPGIRISSLNKTMNNFSSVFAALLKLAPSAQLGERN
jgi:hypothetical protein